MSVCGVCKVAFTGGTIVACVCCNSLFHANYAGYTDFVKAKKIEPKPDLNGTAMNCAEVNASEERVIIQQKEHLMVYRCVSCKENGGISPALQKLLTIVNTKLDEVKETVKTINKYKNEFENVKNNAEAGKDAKDKVEHVFDKVIPGIKDEIIKSKEEIIQEVSEMNRKSKNLIILNIPDKNDKKNDLLLLKDIIKKLKLDITVNIVSYKRLDRLEANKVDSVNNDLDKEDEENDEAVDELMGKNQDPC